MASSCTSARVLRCVHLGALRPVPAALNITDATDAGPSASLGPARWISPAVAQHCFADTIDTAAVATRGDTQVWERAAFVLLVDLYAPCFAARGVSAIT